jgi:hypothetical protein
MQRRSCEHPSVRASSTRAHDRAGLVTGGGGFAFCIVLEHATWVGGTVATLTKSSPKERPSLMFTGVHVPGMFVVFPPKHTKEEYHSNRAFPLVQLAEPMGSPHEQPQRELEPVPEAISTRSAPLP